MADAPALSEKTSVETAEPPVDYANESPSQENELMTEQLHAFAEGNTKILDIQQGDLTGDGGQGAALVLDHPGTGSEKQVGRNDLLIPCAQCGGMAGDPFGYIQVNEGRFTVLTEGGSRERWSNEYTFKYSAEQQDWLLEKTVWTMADTETGEERRIELTSKEFGSIRFDELVPETLQKVANK